MRFRRRDDDAAPADDPAPPVDAPPPGSPVVAFAGVLDGRRLWVAVEARPGSIGLRDTASGDVIALPDAAGDDQPDYLAARLDLTGLPAADAVYEVVLVPLGGGATVPVWSPPLAERRSPLAPDGRTRYVLVRGDAGLLRVRRETAKPAAELVALSTTRTSVELCIAGGSGPLSLVTEGRVVASWPGAVDGDRLWVSLTPDALADVGPAMTRVAVGDDLMGVRRRRDDVPDPVTAVPLPPLHAADSETQRLRLRWSPHGFLQARVLPEGSDSSTDEPDDADRTEDDS